MRPGTVALWWHSARPKTLPAAVAPVWIGAVLAESAAWAHRGRLLLILAAAVLIQVGTNYANDYFDFVKGTDTSDRVGPTRATAAGWVRPRQMWRATLATFGLAALIGVVLVGSGGWPILVIGVLSILCGLAYTAGPFPLAYLGWGDLFVLVFFGPVATAGTVWLLAERMTVSALVAGLAPGLISTAILAVNNIRDETTDRRAGKRTWVVRWGHRFGCWEYAAVLLGACLVPVGLAWGCPGHRAAALAGLTVFWAVPLVRRMFRGPTAEELNAMLGQTGRILLVYAGLFTLGWWL